jgi:TRAP-type mannitol/chloroaromatic compound transport system permease small subunit
LVKIPVAKSTGNVWWGAMMLIVSFAFIGLGGVSGIIIGIGLIIGAIILFVKAGQANTWS